MSSNTGYLNRYIPGSSIIHRASPTDKLIVTLAFIVVTASLPAGVWPVYAVLFALVWCGIVVSRIGLWCTFLRSLIFMPFILVSVPTIFTREGVPLSHLDLGFISLTVTDTGATFFASVLLKSWLSLSAATLLASTTPPTVLVASLSAIHVPKVLVAIISMLYRYLSVIADEVQRMMRARLARSASIGLRTGGSLAWRAHVTGGMAGSLFIRTIDRGERVYLAMLARGYDGTVHPMKTDRITSTNIVMTTLAVVLLAVLAIIARLAW